MRKAGVDVTPGDIIASGSAPAPAAQPVPAKAAAASTQPAQAKPKAAAKPAKRAAPAKRASANPPKAPAAPAAEPAAPLAPADSATRRNFFRLDVFDVTVWFEVEEIGSRSVDPKRVTGELGDVSGGGLRMTASAAAAPMPDWPVSKGVKGCVHFTLLQNEPPFELPARLVRRTETTGGFELAVQWDEPQQVEIDRLVHALYQLEVRRRATLPKAAGPGRGRRPETPRPGAKGRSRQPILLGTALGLIVALAVEQTGPSAAAITAVLAVVLAAVYLFTDA